MITQDEYDRVQVLLGRKGNPRPKKHNFAFRGLIRCGECGATVTCEEKNQIICSKCKYKFSCNSKKTLSQVQNSNREDEKSNHLKVCLLSLHQKKKS